MRSGSTVVTVFSGVLLFVGSLMFAQTATTSLRGTVTDPSGAAVANAKVTLANPERGFERTATTTASGGYEFLQLMPGTYMLTVEITGFRRYEQRNVQLLVDTPGTVNVALVVGTNTETVEVSAQQAVINTTDA